MLSDRIGARPLIVAGMALMAGGMAWIAAVATPTVPYGELVPAFVMGGTGMSLYFAPVASLVLSAVRRSEEGKASGVNNTIREVGGVFGVAVLASVFAAAGSYVSPQAFVDGMVPAIWVAAGAVGAATVAAIAIPPKQDVVESVSYLEPLVREDDEAAELRVLSEAAGEQSAGACRDAVDDADEGRAPTASAPAPRRVAYSPSCARCSAAMSNLVIFRKAWVTRARASGSSSAIISSMAAGTTCHERPYLSFSQPHWPSSPPPAVSFSQ